MSTDWKQAIANAVEDTSSGANPTPSSPYETVLKEVLDEFNEQAKFARFEWRRRVVGNLLHLTVMTSPRRLPAERSLMLTVGITDSYVSLPTPAGMGYLKTPTPESFRAYLIEFFTSDNFKTTLRHYRVRNGEPVQGWLKEGHYRSVNRGDQCLELDALEQEKLAKAFEDKSDDRVTISARLLDPFGNFKAYDPDGDYKMLESGGFVLQDITHALSGGVLTVEGVPLLELDWMSS